MVVGQDLGITLDLENWWIRAESKGIRQSTELVPMSVDGRTVTFQHHPTGNSEERTTDWLVLAVPSAPADALYHELRSRGLPVERVGDAVAARRAHAAVIDGERVGAAVPAAEPAPVRVP
jgi:2,4-dienoyl-CoA reductase (NADPH2)